MLIVCSYLNLQHVTAVCIWQSVRQFNNDHCILQNFQREERAADHACTKLRQREMEMAAQVCAQCSTRHTHLLPVSVRTGVRLCCCSCLACMPVSRMSHLQLGLQLCLDMAGLRQVSSQKTLRSYLHWLCVADADEEHRGSIVKPACPGSITPARFGSCPCTGVLQSIL